jgi:hypothetical protein
MTFSAVASNRSIRVLSVALVGVMFAREAAADPKRDREVLAEQLFVEGSKLMRDERYAEACPKLAESHRLDPAGGTALNVALCFEKLGQAATAWHAYRDALAIAERDGRADRVQIATQHLAGLEPKLNSIRVIVATPSTGEVVWRDGVEIPSAAYDTDVYVDPGSHVLEARAPKKKPWRMDVVVDSTQQRATVSVPALTDEGEGAAPSATSDGRSTLMWAGIAGLGIGGVAAVIGTVFGVSANIQDSDALAMYCSGTTCHDPRGVALTNDARDAAVIANVSFVIAGIALVGGGLAFLLSRNAPSRTAATRSGWAF